MLERNATKILYLLIIRLSINNSIIQYLNDNSVLFCPHCGAKIFRRDLSAKSTEDIYESPKYYEIAKKYR